MFSGYSSCSSWNCFEYFSGSSSSDSASYDCLDLSDVSPEEISLSASPSELKFLFNLPHLFLVFFLLSFKLHLKFLRLYVSLLFGFLSFFNFLEVLYFFLLLFCKLSTSERLSNLLTWVAFWNGQLFLLFSQGLRQSPEEYCPFELLHLKHCHSRYWNLTTTKQSTIRCCSLFVSGKLRRWFLWSGRQLL